MSETQTVTGPQIVARVSDELAKVALDTHAILTTVAKTLSEVRSGTWVALLMNKDPSTSVLVVTDKADPGLAIYIEKYLATMYRPGATPTIGLSQRVIETGAPLLMTNVSRIGLIESVAAPAAREFVENNPPPVLVDTLGLLVVPMRAQGGVVGTLGVFDWHCPDSLTEAEAEWLQVVADRTGAALEHAQLHAAAIYRLERLAALRSALLAIGSSQDLRLTLEVIAEQVTDRLQADAADILLFDEGESELSVAISVGFHSASIPNQRFRWDPARMDPAVVSGRGGVMAAPGVGREQRLSLFAREGFQSYVAMPLVVRNNFQGVIEVFHRSKLEPDQEWFDFLSALASVAAIAIDSAALLRQVHIDGLTDPSRKRHSPAPDMTRLELQILKSAVEGRTNREISAEVHLSQNTIKFHIRQILQKAGVANRTELAREVTRQGWL
jgi:GAF domain-containing protein/DNA-binding CsgD family transcriptional regulator